MTFLSSSGSARAVGRKLLGHSEDEFFSVFDRNKYRVQRKVVQERKRVSGKENVVASADCVCGIPHSLPIPARLAAAGLGAPAAPDPRPFPSRVSHGARAARVPRACPPCPAAAARRPSPSRARARAQARNPCLSRARGRVLHPSGRRYRGASICSIKPRIHERRGL